MAELTWQKVLQAQQQDFIQRLKRSLDIEKTEVVTLSCLDYDYHYGFYECYPTEKISISLFERREEEIDQFCWELAEKFDEDFSEDCYMNNKIGKLGEEAVKIYLDELITKVDYEIYCGGDGGSDFFLKKNNNIGLQVKTKTLNRISFKDEDNLNDEDLYIEYMALSSSLSGMIDKVNWSISQ